MQIDDVSDQLFGRYQALRIYVAIAQLQKDEFTVGGVAALADASTSSVSREMGRLADLGAIIRVSRRGDYQRVSASPFWFAVDALAHLGED